MRIMTYITNDMDYVLQGTIIVIDNLYLVLDEW